MTRSRFFRAAAVLGIFGLGVATGLAAPELTAPGLTASTSTDSPRRVEQKRTDLTGAPDMEVIASVGEYKPGETLGLHTHHGVEVAYVLQGATVRIPGREEPVLLATGSTTMNLRDVKHAGFTVVGGTPLKLFTVHVVDKGKPLYDYSK